MQQKVTGIVNKIYAGHKKIPTVHKYRVCVVHIGYDGQMALDKFTVCSHLAPDLAVMLISGDKIEIHTRSNLSDFSSGKQIRKISC